MLVLSRKTRQQIKIGDNVTVTILLVKGNTVRIGIDAPRNVRVLRAELPVHDDDHDDQMLDVNATESTVEVAPLADRLPRNATASVKVEDRSNPSPSRLLSLRQRGLLAARSANVATLNPVGLRPILANR